MLAYSHTNHLCIVEFGESNYIYTCMTLSTGPTQAEAWPYDMHCGAPKTRGSALKFRSCRELGPTTVDQPHQLLRSRFLCLTTSSSDFLVVPYRRKPFDNHPPAPILGV